jgi:hypothetical protein
MALVLLVGAGTDVAQPGALWRVDPGFNPSHAITFSLSMPDRRRQHLPRRARACATSTTTMRSIPGVEAVSVTFGSRPMIHDSELPFWIEGQPKPAND